jgi:hypothetical protein
VRWRDGRRGGFAFARPVKKGLCFGRFGTRGLAHRRRPAKLVGGDLEASDPKRPEDCVMLLFFGAGGPESVKLRSICMLELLMRLRAAL